MADTQEQRRPARFTTGGLSLVALLLAAALGALLVVRDHHANAGLSAQEQAAVDAASHEMINLQTFRLAHFDADFGRARTGLTGELLKAFSPRRAALHQGLMRSRQDTSASVTQAAFEQSKGNNALVLMTMNNYRVDAKGKQTLFDSGRFEVTVTKVGGRWLASNLTSVGLM
jgi:Mce-associated membrane protein